MPDFTLIATGSDGQSRSVLVTVQSGVPVAGEVRTAAEITARANDPASEGKVFHVRGGNYGNLTLAQVRNAPVIFRAYPGEEGAVVYGTAQLNGRNLVLDGGRATKVRSTRGTDCSFIRIKTTSGFIADGVTRLLIDLCDLPGGSECNASSGQVNRGITVRRSRLRETREDALYTWGVQDLLIEDNEFTRVGYTQDQSIHCDCFQVYPYNITQFPCERITVRRNYMHDCWSEGHFQKDGRVYDITCEDNLAVRCHGYGEGGPGLFHNFYDCTRLTIRRNTGWATTIADLGLRTGNREIRMTGNLLRNFVSDGDAASNYSERYHNVFGSPTSVSLAALEMRVSDSTPVFRDSAVDDYRLAQPLTAGSMTFQPDEVGVSWAPSEKQYGPEW